jgi:hypothetical protein
MEYNFRVVPCVYKRGFCPTLCETLQDALEEQDFWNEHTDFEWAIEGMNEQAEQELVSFFEYEPTKEELELIA